MPPAGLWLFIKYVLGIGHLRKDNYGRIRFINKIASQCVTVLTATAFIQVGLYIFTVTQGPHIIDFLDVIY